MYHVAICDDNAADSALLQRLVTAWAAARERDVRIKSYPSAQKLLFDQEDEPADIFLLDIEMEGMDGVTLAKTLRRSNDMVQIVFVTGYSDYLAEGYEVAALHYLMKPVKDGKFMQVMDRAVNALQKNERCVTLKAEGGTVRLPISRILYADVQKNYVTVHADDAYIAKMTLTELETMLDDRFYRVGRSAVVNLLCVRRVTKTDIVLTSGDTIPLPHGAYGNIQRAIMRLD